MYINVNQNVYTVYRVILARWKFWLYWRMTKIRQIKKRQFFQLQNLKMSEIELHYHIYGVYLYLSINTLKPVIGSVINTLDDHVNWPWSYTGILLSGLNTNLVYGKISDMQSFLGYFKILSLTVLSISYLVSIEIAFLFVKCTTQRSKI